MSQAENLLNSLAEDIQVHTHYISDPDGLFVIDPNTRMITSTSEDHPILMQYDHDSEIFTFEVPRYIENHDMSLCNKVKVHFVNIDGASMAERADVHEIYDFIVEEDCVICSWKIDRRATQYAGTLNFLLQYLCLDENGKAVYEWHTDIYTGVIVKKGMNNGNAIVLEYSDVLEQWYARLFGAGDSVMESIEMKGAEVLDSIPDDYATVAKMAEDANRYKANAIGLEAEGNSISVNNSDDAYLMGLKIYGETTQPITTGINLFNPSNLLRAGWTETYTGTYVGSSKTLDGRTVDYIDFKANTQYAISFNAKASGNGSSALAIDVYYTDGDSVTAITVSSSINTKPYDFITAAGKTIDTIRFSNVIGQTTWLWDVQITEGNLLWSYEPYSGGEASPSLKYPQNLYGVTNVTVNISGEQDYRITVPGTLHGIKGICDEADFKNGVIHQRVKTMRFTGEEPWVDMSAETYLYGNKLFPKLPTWDIEAYPCAIVFYNDTDKCYRFAAFPGALSYGPVDTINEGQYSCVYYCTLAGTTSTRIVSNYVDGAWTELETKTIGSSAHTYNIYTSFFNVFWTNTDILNVSDGSIYMNGTNPVESPDGIHPAYCLNLDVKSVSGLCTHLNRLTESEFNAGKQGVYLEQRNTAVMQVKNAYPTLSAFKTFLASGRVTIAYATETSTEVPLDENAIMQYSRAKTSYPNTAFTNDDDAYMKVEYAADTRCYFETLLGVIENGSY